MLSIYQLFDCKNERDGMSEWKTYKYTDIATIVGGGTPKTTEVAYWNGKIPWISIKDLVGTIKYVYSTEKYITELGLTKSSAKLLHEGDIVISARGTIGEIAILSCPMSFNQSCFGICANENIVDGTFLYYLTKTKINALKAVSYGSVFDTITSSTFENLEISLPPLPEQKRIAGILSALDDKIELNRRINANLEAQAMALYKHWFVDFEFPNSAEKPYKSSGGKMIDSDFGPIPAGWHIGKVNDLGIIICGKTPSKAIAANYGDAIPFIKIPDMHNHVFVHKSDEMLSIVGSDSQIKKLLPPYSVLVSCIATVGLVSMNVVPSHTNQQINSVIPNDVIYRYYLYLMFKNMALDLQNYGRGGTATLNVNTSTFANIKVLLPSRQILEWFYLRIQSMFELIRYNQEEIYNLSSIRNALLHKLIREEIKM